MMRSPLDTLPDALWSNILECCQLPSLTEFAGVSSAALSICAQHLASKRTALDFRPRHRWRTNLVIAVLECSARSASSAWLSVISQRTAAAHAASDSLPKSRIEAVHFSWYYALVPSPECNEASSFHPASPASSSPSPSATTNHDGDDESSCAIAERRVLMLLREFPELRSLTLGPVFAHVLDSPLLRALLQAPLGARLRSLNIEGCVRLDGETLDLLLSSLCPNIRELNVAGTAITNAESILLHTPVEELDLSLTVCNEATAQRMDARPQGCIKRLVWVDPDRRLPIFDFDEQINSWFRNALASLHSSRVREAEHQEHHLADDAWSLIPTEMQIANLCALHGEMWEADSEFRDGFENALEIVQRARRWQRSEETRGAAPLLRVPSVFLGGFPWSHLQHLCMNDQQLFGDASLLGILALIGPQLRHLELEHTDVGELGICAIGTACSQIRVLNLGRLEISEKAIAAIAIGCGSTLRDFVAFFAFNIGSVRLNRVYAQYCYDSSRMNAAIHVPRPHFLFSCHLKRRSLCPIFALDAPNFDT